MCNIVCINKICDIMGSCKYGCDNSKYGKECDKECMKYCKICFNLIMCLECEVGYFGKLCIMCLENCIKCENRLISFVVCIESKCFFINNLFGFNNFKVVNIF